MDTITQLYNENIEPYINMETIVGAVFGLALFSALWEWLSSNDNDGNK